MEEKDRALKNVETSTMVECPFCKQGIEAPDKPGVIFECPNCHKELITYDKRREQPRIQPEKELEKQLKVAQLKYWIAIGVVAILALFLVKFYLNKRYESVIDKDVLTTIRQNAQTINENNNGQQIGSWKGKTWDNRPCSYTLIKEGDGYQLIEQSTSKVYNCTRHVLKSPTEYYFVDSDIADINKHLACFNLNAGTPIYIIHSFDYDHAHDKSMDGILVIFSDYNVRIYLDMQINGTAYYLNNGNPPISRINSKGELEYFNEDGTNEPAYERYAVLH